MKKTPLTLVKERFGDKEKLVAAVEKLATAELWLDRVSDVKGLALVSNAKLLRLHDVLETTKSKFGSREKLISSIAELEKRTDEGFKTRLARYPLPRLLDLHAATEKRTKRLAKAESKPATTPAKRRARSKKARAKAKAA